MTQASRAREGRQRGTIDRLPSRTYRVRVYAGVDPLTGRAHYLTETIPDGPDGLKLAKQAWTRLLAEVDQKRNPHTKATVVQLMDRYLELLDVDVNTRRGYRGYIRNHIRPLLGTCRWTTAAQRRAYFGSINCAREQSKCGQDLCYKYVAGPRTSTQSIRDSTPRERSTFTR